MIARLLLLLVASTTLPLSAGAETVQFCIKHTGKYEDNDATDAAEDYWKDDNPKLARGAYTEVWKNTDGDPELEQIWWGFLGDDLGVGDPGLGCTPLLTVTTANGDYEVHVSSYGVVNGNDVEAHEYGTGNLWGVTQATTVTGGNGSVKTVTLSITEGTNAWKVFNVYQAGAYALYRHGGGMTENYDFRVGMSSGSSPSNGFGRATQQIGISYNNWDEKFQALHAMGHAVSEFATAGVMNDGQNYGMTGHANCPTEPGGGSGSHSMRSEEYVGAAAGEGFANFWPADVFNSDDELDCEIEYWQAVNGVGTPVVDCENAAGSPDFSNSYHLNVCGGGVGAGVELDWMRAFWDVHTDGAAPDPSFTAIVNWLAGAAAEGNWNSTSAYDELNEEANELDGTDLETNWNAIRTTLDGV